MLFPLINEEYNRVTIPFTIGITAIGSDHEPARGRVGYSFSMAILVVLAALLTMDVRNVLGAWGTTILRRNAINKSGTNGYLPSKANKILGDSVLYVGIQYVGVTTQ